MKMLARLLTNIVVEGKIYFGGEFNPRLYKTFLTRLAKSFSSC